MKRMTTTAAALMLAATPVLAQQTTGGGDDGATTGQVDWSQMIRTRDVTGGPVYTTDPAEDEGAWGGDGADDGYSWGWSGYDTVDPNWNQIGEIEDVVLNDSGELAGLVAEVGGFLDIGDKHVFLAVEDLDLVPMDDGGFAMITRYNEEELEDMEGVDEGWWQ